MTFLNPAILFGLFAASIPIVLHFLNLRKLTKIEFSTLQFLKELQKTKIRRIKLKQWLLLLLRVLIIICLVMAFARPTLKSISLGGSSTAKTSAVIIIDNTFSMSVVTGKGSYLNQAKQIAKNLLNNFQQGDEITILATADFSSGISTPTTNFAEAQKNIEKIEISNISKTLNDGMIRGAQILYQSRNYNKEIFLLTDCQKERLINSPKEISNFGKTLSPETRFYLFDLGEKRSVNLGVEGIKAASQIFEVGKLVGFSIRVKNYSASSINNNVVSLFMNGKRCAQQNISLNSGESKEISFETTLKDTGLVEISAELEDDEILQDNKVFTSTYVPSKISLLLLTDKAEDSRLIKLALGLPNDKIKLSEVSNSQLSSINPKHFDIIFIIGTNGISNAQILADYISSGGSTVVFPGSQNTLASFQNFCSALGIQTPSVMVGKINSDKSISEFRQTDFQHPLLKNIFENINKIRLASPEIFSYFKTNLSEKGENIISLLDNSSFLSESKFGKGKIILFSSAPILSWNSFPMKAFFAPLMNNSLLYCSAKLKDDSTFICGGQIIADISGTPDQQLKIIAPDKNQEFINTDSLSNKNYLFYDKTEQPGIYQFFSGKKRLDYISVNHDPRESVTEKYSENDVKDYLENISYEGKFIPLSSKDNYSKEIYQSRFGTELWKYFLILVLILAVAESLLSKSNKKDLT
jgi:hypothetical protein